VVPLPATTNHSFSEKYLYISLTRGICTEQFKFISFFKTSTYCRMRRFIRSRKMMDVLPATIRLSSGQEARQVRGCLPAFRLSIFSPNLSLASTE
jgi:hypothetical protein